MRKFLGAAGFAAVIGTLSAAMLSADSTVASPTEAVNLSDEDIVIDPALLENESQSEATTSDADAEKAASNGNRVSDANEIQVAGSGTHGAAATVDAPVALAAPSYASLRDLVRAQPRLSALSTEMECLAGTVYFESKGESLEGQLAVAEVVLGRRDSRRWPNSVCGVVYQRSQFSFVRSGRMPYINKGSAAWRRAVAIAQIASDGSWESPVKGSLFFHANYVSPGWRLTRVGSIDNHIFYR